MKKRHLHIDIETYCEASIDLGRYRYIDDDTFEIMLVAYAFDDKDVKIVDLANGERLPSEFIDALLADDVVYHAHNASFERNAFKKIGYAIPAIEWECSAAKASYCGLPASLEGASTALNIKQKKLTSGKELIRLFSVPCKPTAKNGNRTRNTKEHFPEEWQRFKEYCIRDVEAEREIDEILSSYEFPASEKKIYALNELINDRGILIDTTFVNSAIELDLQYKNKAVKRAKEVTGLDNPSSVSQLKSWIKEQTGVTISTLNADSVPELLDSIDNSDVIEMLELRPSMAKSSTAKYQTALDCLCKSGKVHGTLKYYGARTGRFAGRYIQPQNMPRIKISDKEISFCRDAVTAKRGATIELIYGNVSSIISQLVRTFIVADVGKELKVADYSAIEARVTAWLADEQWRLDVFATHGKIYEASAAMMFNIPIDEVTPEQRFQGKTAELALGYQGGIAALKRMAKDKWHTIEAKASSIVSAWRKKSPNIVKMWKDLEECAFEAYYNPFSYVSYDSKKGVDFYYDKKYLTISLPSGRSLYYYKPYVGANRFNSDSLCYWGVNSQTYKWEPQDIYGGKFTENIVQAISRDLLCHAMLLLEKEGYKTILNVHDEIVCETSINDKRLTFDRMAGIMTTAPSWAENLPLNVSGFVSPYYKK